MTALRSDNRAVGNSQDLEIDLVNDISTIKHEWEALQAAGTSFVYQNFDWVNIAYQTFELGNIPVVVVGRVRGKLIFIIPLVLVKGFPNILRWVGANHNNIGAGLFSWEFLSNSDENPDVMHQAFAKAAELLPNRPTLLHLKNQPQHLAGFRNPMLRLPHQPNPNPFYTMNLEHGLDTILDMGNGKRKRKLFRRQQRVADRMGGYELFIPKDQREVTEVIEEFFAIKAQRFAELGVPDVFADEPTQKFLHRLAIEPEKDGVQLLRLFVLRVGGKLRALYGCGISGTYCQSCINAFADDDFAEVSPGEMIMYMMVEHLIESGFSKLDIGLGYERYKASWCKNPSQIMDTIHPLTYSAAPFAHYLKSETRLKRLIKNNDLLWENLKRIRKLKSRI